MWYARDNFDLDPHWKYCPGCDRDFEAGVKFSPDGLCPDCAEKASRKEEAEEDDE